MSEVKKKKIDLENYKAGWNCECGAWGQCECGCCDADWTDKRIYEVLEIVEQIENGDITAPNDKLLSEYMCELIREKLQQLKILP